MWRKNLALTAEEEHNIEHVEGKGISQCRKTRNQRRRERKRNKKSKVEEEEKGEGEGEEKKNREEGGRRGRR